jgi:hypothetical protein
MARELKSGTNKVLMLMASKATVAHIQNLLLLARSGWPSVRQLTACR